MGLFDMVVVPCPKCGTPLEYQTKADISPSMAVYNIDDAPNYILSDIVNAPEYHSACGAWVCLMDPNFKPLAPPPPRPAPVGVVLKPPKEACGDQDYKWWPEFEPITLDHVDVEHAPSKAALNAILAARAAQATAVRRAAAIEIALEQARTAILDYDAGGSLQEALNALRGCADLAQQGPT